jgi:hypothetical protein
MGLSAQKDLSSSSYSPNIDTDVVRVAMLSMIFQNWSRLWFLREWDRVA